MTDSSSSSSDEDLFEPVFSKKSAEPSANQKRLKTTTRKPTAAEPQHASDQKAPSLDEIQQKGKYTPLYFINLVL